MGVGKSGMGPLDYARAACDTMMGRFAAAELPPKGHFHYHQGVFLSGMYRTYLLVKRQGQEGAGERYFDYIKKWVGLQQTLILNIKKYFSLPPLARRQTLVSHR